MGKWLTWKNLLCFTLCFTSFDELGRTQKAIAERESHIHLWVVWLLRAYNWNWFLNLTVSGASVSMKLEIWWGQWWEVCGLNAKWLSFIYFKGQHDLVHFTIYQPWGKTVESAAEHEEVGRTFHCAAKQVSLWLVLPFRPGWKLYLWLKNRVASPSCCCCFFLNALHIISTVKVK